MSRPRSRSALLRSQGGGEGQKVGGAAAGLTGRDDPLDATARLTTMPYTLWSRDTLLGESELALPSSAPGTLVGMFMPSADAADALPTLTGLLHATLQIRAMLDREGITRERSAFSSAVLSPSPEPLR